ncbi:hypothetical protein HK099_000286 [Clydaea vesicula]|uniref:Uncharacterized protein n=1 Tax=Clydaea vesicula TaxID=447962 RepID=A0AAD5U4L7_9FUNG|nr:hypothetical protein HK099_000286 [Clydaea vesicula]
MLTFVDVQKGKTQTFECMSYATQLLKISFPNDDNIYPIDKGIVTLAFDANNKLTTNVDISSLIIGACDIYSYLDSYKYVLFDNVIYMDSIESEILSNIKLSLKYIRKIGEMEENTKLYNAVKKILSDIISKYPKSHLVELLPDKSGDIIDGPLNIQMHYYSLDYYIGVSELTLSNTSTHFNDIHNIRTKYKTAWSLFAKTLTNIYNLDFNIFKRNTYGYGQIAVHSLIWTLTNRNTDSKTLSTFKIVIDSIYNIAFSVANIVLDTHTVITDQELVMNFLTNVIRIRINFLGDTTAVYKYKCMVNFLISVLYCRTYLKAVKSDKTIDKTLLDNIHDTVEYETDRDQDIDVVVYSSLRDIGFEKDFSIARYTIRDSIIENFKVIFSEKYNTLNGNSIFEELIDKGTGLYKGNTKYNIKDYVNDINIVNEDVFLLKFVMAWNYDELLSTISIDNGIWEVFRFTDDDYDRFDENSIFIRGFRRRYSRRIYIRLNRNLSRAISIYYKGSLSKTIYIISNIYRQSNKPTKLEIELAFIEFLYDKQNNGKISLQILAEIKSLNAIFEQDMFPYMKNNIKELIKSLIRTLVHKSNISEDELSDELNISDIVYVPLSKPLKLIKWEAYSLVIIMESSIEVDTDLGYPKSIHTIFGDELAKKFNDIVYNDSAYVFFHHSSDELYALMSVVCHGNSIENFILHECNSRPASAYVNGYYIDTSYTIILYCDPLKDFLRIMELPKMYTYWNGRETIVMTSIWNPNVVRRFNTIDIETGEKQYYPAYNALLYTEFPISDDFFVAPQAHPLDTNESIDFVVEYLLYRDNKPIFFIEVKPHNRLRSASARGEADTQMRKRFLDLLDNCPLRSLYGMSVFGTNFCLYNVSKEFREVYPTEVPRNAKILTDIAPKEWWNKDILNDNDAIILKNLFDEIKRECQAL